MDVDDWTVDVQNQKIGRQPAQPFNRQRPTNWQLRTLANFIEKTLVGYSAEFRIFSSQK
jgi:hypothetical protein